MDNRYYTSIKTFVLNQCVLSHSMALKSLSSGMLKLSEYIGKLQTLKNLLHTSQITWTGGGGFFWRGGECVNNTSVLDTKL